MFSYFLRKILYAIPVLLGVNILTFSLFFVLNSPDDMARAQLGNKYVTPTMISQWKVSHQYDLPLYYNETQTGLAKWTDTLLFKKSLAQFTFQFGNSDQGRNINADISQRMWPSLAIAVPTLILEIIVNIGFALMLIFFRYTSFELTAVLICVALMSISGLFYIIGGQYLFAKVLKLVPISGYETGLDAWHFLILPIMIGVISGIGSGTRWYRSIFMEEISKDYVRTARAKGLSEVAVLFRHVLKNGMLPILTSVVVIIPTLFMGSLLLESFFGIPGLGSYMIDAIRAQDFAIVRTMVFLGTVFYVLGLILTDLTYLWVDPRVRLE
ncbi:MAG: ABC transporter permease [Legionellales bacterium]|nr:ABC transporter permease [Legionellales bacterium]